MGRPFLLLVCLASTIGCHAESAEPLVPVRGQLTVDGAAIAGVELVFHPQGEGPGWMPVATTDADGAFAASTRVPGDGVPPGRYKVTAVWRPVVDENGEGPNKLPRKYASPTSTPLEVVAEKLSADPVTFSLSN